MCLLIIIAINYLQVASALDPRIFAVRIDNITSKYDATFILTNITYNETTVNVVVNVLPLDRLTLHLNLMIRVRDRFGRMEAAGIHSRHSTQGYTNFLNKTIDYCQFMENGKGDGFLKSIYDSAFSKGRNNYFRKCPIKIGRYFIKDFTFDLGKLPTNLPSLYFNLFIRVSHKTNNETNPRSMLYEYRTIGLVGHKQGLNRRHTKL